jgi:MFS transporter, DHA1 family, inner membrane transport protein
MAIGEELFPLFALTLGVFGIGTTEFAIVGLLPEISAGLGVSIAKTGLLVTGYAIGVAIGGPIMAVLSNRLSRKSALLLLISLFVLGNALAAVAPSYGLLLLARIVTSFCHGSFVGIASVVAVDIVPTNWRATAIAVVWAGFSASSIIGVPAGTALGQTLGWRWTFGAIAVLGVVAALLILRLLPRTARNKSPDLASEFRVLARPILLLALALSALVCAAGFGVYTYIAPILLKVTGISGQALPMILLVFGVGGRRCRAHP